MCITSRRVEGVTRALARLSNEDDDLQPPYVYSYNDVAGAGGMEFGGLMLAS